MTKIEELRYEADLREAYEKGEKIEFKSTNVSKWIILNEGVNLGLSPFYGHYRLHDPYREFKEAEKEGKTLQILNSLGEWTDVIIRLSWTSPPENYRIKPDDPTKPTHRTPITSDERLRLIKTILYSPNEAKAIVRGVQAIIEEE